MNIYFLFFVIVFEFKFNKCLRLSDDMPKIMAVDNKYQKKSENDQRIFTTCSYKCLNKNKPISNPTYVSGPNGCGTYNIIIDFSSFNLNEFTLCCNSHDTCFGTCNSGKNNCDSLFKTCLDNFCNQKFGNSFRNFFKKIICLKSANAMYEAVENFGCVPYLTAQKSACLCNY